MWSHYMPLQTLNIVAKVLPNKNLECVLKNKNPWTQFISEVVSIFLIGIKIITDDVSSCLLLLGNPIKFPIKQIFVSKLWFLSDEHPVYNVVLTID